MSARNARTGTYLDEILEHKRNEVRDRFVEDYLPELEELAIQRDEYLSLYDALKWSGTQVIAEIKYRSPSKGDFPSHLDPVQLAGRYLVGGAAAVSVLTDSRFFGGSMLDMWLIHKSPIHAGLRILRKEFIIDRRQLIESVAMGADAVLLIVAALGEDLSSFLSSAADVGLEALVEVHDEKELDIALSAGALIIGVNNRDLRTFETDVAVSERLLPLIPRSVARVAESGIRTTEDVRRVAAAGADAVLVGETLMLADDPAAAIRELLEC
ncbi:MAG: indole-3-glycerol phosphate synthase TrpC [Dehalococcoidia bacterium]